MGYVKDSNLPDLQNRTSGYYEVGDTPEIEVHKSTGEIEVMYFTADENSPGGTEFQPFGHAVGRLNNKMETPLSVVLYKAYPNPFNPVTTIKYDLNISTNVEFLNFLFEVRKFKNP